MNLNDTPLPTVLVVGDSPAHAPPSPSGEAFPCRLLHAADLPEALRQADQVVPDLVLLFDGAGDDALDLCRRLRDLHPASSSFLLLNAAGSPEEMGIDQRLEFIRDGLAALLRRDRPSTSLPPADPEERSSQGLVMNSRRHRATLDGRALELTPTEFRLLWRLLAEPGLVFTRRELTEACIGPGTHVQVRTIDVHVKAIRRKLGDRAELLETVRGIGYRFRDPEGP